MSAIAPSRIVPDLTTLAVAIERVRLRIRELAQQGWTAVPKTARAFKVAIEKLIESLED